MVALAPLKHPSKTHILHPVRKGDNSGSRLREGVQSANKSMHNFRKAEEYLQHFWDFFFGLSFQKMETPLDLPLYHNLLWVLILHMIYSLHKMATLVYVHIKWHCFINLVILLGDTVYYATNLIQMWLQVTNCLAILHNRYLRYQISKSITTT